MVSDAGIFDRELSVAERPVVQPVCCAVGTYDCAKPVLNFTKPHPTLVYIDMCMIPEIVYLWNHGVNTEGSCCGHGCKYGEIAVDLASSGIMDYLGYERLPNPYGSEVYKSKSCTDEWAKIAYDSSMEHYEKYPDIVCGKKWKNWLESYREMKDMESGNHGNDGSEDL